MSDTKHTPGPFLPQFNEIENRWSIVADNGSRPYLIAVVENGQPGDSLDTEEATAHLLAAAPEMLEALELAERFIKSDCMDHAIVNMPNAPVETLGDRLRSVIAKATGEEIK